MASDIYPIQESDRMQDQLRTCIWLAEMMVSTLQQYFGSPERIALATDALQWNPSEAESQVFISTVDNLEYDKMGLRPAILVDIEDHTYPEEVKGDQHSYNPETGFMGYVVRDKSAWSVECWSPLKLGSMSIADEVRFFLTTYRHLIAKKYCFDKMRVRQQMKPVRYAQFKDHWITRVIVEYELQDQWSVVNEQLKLTGFGLNLNLK